MRKLIGFTLAAAIAGTGVTAASARLSAAPALQLVQRGPLEVKGVHFKALERVRLTAKSARQRAVAHARTSRRGAFVATFTGFTPNYCVELVVQAVGTRGDKARLVVQPPPIVIPCRA